ncbi:MAG: GTP-binding protein [Candidatus Lokiarchaeota archaeon]|nr:GTP-binding protein [Candidatus Lokiarchaeota archaeon]
MNDTPLKFVFKITVIGDGGVGKTSLIKKYTQGTFEEDYISTIGAQFSFYDEKINGDECKLYFWDIAGQKEFEFLRSDFYEESKAAIIVYSLEDKDLGKESLNHIEYWYNDLKQGCGDIPVIIFANKVDLINEDKLDDEFIQNFIKEKDIIGVYRTSAKTNQGVTEAFQKIIRELYEKSKSNI